MKYLCAWLRQKPISPVAGAPLMPGGERRGDAFGRGVSFGAGERFDAIDRRGGELSHQVERAEHRLGDLFLQGVVRLRRRFGPRSGRGAKKSALVVNQRVGCDDRGRCFRARRNRLNCP